MVVPTEVGPPPLPQLRVGGCLSPFWAQWQQLGAEPWTVEVLRRGYRIPWIDNQLPPVSASPIPFQSCAPGSPGYLALDQEISKMLDKGALEIVENQSPGFYSRIFLVEKASGGWRPVIDLSPLNKFVSQTKFKMETIASVLASIREGDFMASLDLKDAYFQVPIHQASRRYLRFVWGGVVHQFKALCFGLSTAPQVFTRVFATVSAWAHTAGIRLRRYLDDWLIVAESAQLVREALDQLLQVCRDLGIVVNMEKSNLQPSTQTKYLGVLIDSVRMDARPTDTRINNFLEITTRFLAQPSPPARLWQSVLGHMASLEKLVPGARLRMRALQFRLREHWSTSEGSPTHPVPLSDECVEELLWWREEGRLSQGVPLMYPPPTMLLFTDASLNGWGAHLEELVASGVWTGTDRNLHINILEMRAVWLALLAFQERLMGHRVALMSDNTTVVAYINKQGGTVSSSLYLLTKQILTWAELHSVSLVGRFVPGHRNVLADQLSRQDQVISTEWSLHPRIVQAVFRSWGTPTVDMFATSLNNRLPVYCSPVPDPLAWKVDAFTVPWDGLDVYAFPPFPVIRLCINRVLTSQRTRVTLIAPKWPRQEWYPDLLALCVEEPLELPLWRNLLRQPHSQAVHGALGRLGLHAWKLSSEAYEREAFLSQLQLRYPPRSGSPPPTSTRANGPFSVVGVVKGVSLRSQQLFSR